ncbi:MAG: FAD-binding oxidoreductase [Alphaproteobacteria bacterium]|nr:FAD-binding oxidoreductase [Alphaproteobacteria bacterium]
MTEIQGEPLYRLIQSGVQGEGYLPGDSWSSDFGGVVRRAPRVVVRPQHEQDIFHCFSIAKEAGVTVSFRGAGHSCHGQTLSDGGILIENVGDSADFKLLDDGQVEVRSKTRWHRLEKGLNEQGRSIPVTTDYLNLSVGGTLSVGGYGIHSVTRGAQVDHVTRLRLLLPDGTSRWCSENEHSDLFRFSLAGLGQMGFIEKVVTKTVPYRRFVRLYQYSYRNIVEFLDSLTWMQGWSEAWPSHFCALVGYGQTLSEFGFEHNDQKEAEGYLNADISNDLPRPNYRGVFQNYRFALHRSLTEYINCDKDAYRIWADYAFDYSNFRRFLLFAAALRSKGVFGSFLDRIYILACRRPEAPTAFPFEVCGALPPPIKFGVGLYNTVPRGNERALNQVTRAMEICLDKCLELGGKPYLYGWHELDAVKIQKLYGPDYDRFLELKRQHDSNNIIQSPW